jgi:uncharacterized membrane protein
MNIYLELIIIALLTLSFDAFYLYFNVDSFKRMIFDIQHTAMEFRLVPAIVCYFFLIVGIYYFIIREKKSVMEAFLLGLVIYAVYDSTNYAFLKNYSLSFAIMDALWGGILFALVTYVYRLFA